MADGHFPDVELLRRELAMLVLEWAGKAVKDDPDGPLSTALTRAVNEAARSAVAEQHQALSADAADLIAEALERRGKAGGLFLWRATPWGLGLMAVAAAALLAIAFFVGLQTGRTEIVLPPAQAATAAPIAPLAPAVSEPPPSAAEPRAAPPQAPAKAQQRSAAPTKPAAKPQPREVGRPAPAPAGDEAPPRSTQPVGAAATTPTPAPKTTPQ